MSKQQKIRVITEILSPTKPPEMPEIYIAPDGRNFFVGSKEAIEKIKARYEKQEGGKK